MRRVIRDECDAALEVLRDAREALLADMAAFPRALNTEWRQRKRAEMDERLLAMDEAIRMYEQPVVYVPADAPRIGAGMQEGDAAS
jgi:hypothetical protein